mmetsp:Transcript_38181/g.61816  ORF Transcript_38181/g.61816 Transcript_38181/m.61816 type:complete len:201 (-) Transcript_38181:3315-3917(-)
MNTLTKHRLITHRYILLHSMKPGRGHEYYINEVNCKDDLILSLIITVSTYPSREFNLRGRNFNQPSCPWVRLDASRPPISPNGVNECLEGIVMQVLGIEANSTRLGRSTAATVQNCSGSFTRNHLEVFKQDQGVLESLNRDSLGGADLPLKVQRLCNHLHALQQRRFNYGTAPRGRGRGRSGSRGDGGGGGGGGGGGVHL